MSTPQTTFAGFPLIKHDPDFGVYGVALHTVVVEDVCVKVAEHIDGSVSFASPWGAKHWAWGGIWRYVFHPPWTWFKPRKWLIRRAALKAVRQKPRRITE